MKKVNKINCALALALGVAATAQAQTIYIAGSTAFHNQVGAAMADLGLGLNQGTAGATIFTASGAVTDVKGLGFSTTGLGAVTVEADFAGSAEGVFSVAKSQSPGYLTTTGAADNPAIGADLAFSDVQASTTSYASIASTLDETSAADADTATTGLTGVAIQVFGWFGNSQARTLGVNNVTPSIISSLYGSGTLGINFWTGANPSASTNVVYAVGRTNDSGSRVSALVDIGLNFNKSLSQYALNGTLGTPPVGAGDSLLPVGNNGYASGGNVALCLSDDTCLLPAIAYIGLSDAQAKLWSNHGTNVGALTFEGVSIGTSNAWNLTAVENGEYSFWNYEHLYNNPGTATFVTNNFAPALVRALEYEITNTTESPVQTTVVFSEMNVSRFGDGAAVVNGN